MATQKNRLSRPVRKLAVNIDRCTGCMACTLACSYVKSEVFSPPLAHIRVLKLEESGVDAPLVCQQCDEPRCIEACPIDAMVRDGSTGMVLVDEAVCDGCGVCMVACPYGAIGAVSADNKKRRRILKCDLCGGNPACVPWCETQALEYLPADSEDMTRSMEHMVMVKKRFEIENGLNLWQYFDGSRRRPEDAPGCTDGQ
jgi:anaerobic carbon-monoxide dehydrogenase iron sulfur subunit